ncbi:MAG: very short patch repair endonuclease [Gemmatimonadaceae bacterium]
MSAGELSSRRGRVSAVRSRIMSAIRGKDTKPEMLVRRAIHAAGLRYRLHRRDLPGSPDIVITRLRTVVFVHGCFWHHHDCRDFKWPKTRAAFWRAKIDANVARDRRTRYFLKAAGWTVHTIWECELADGRTLPKLVRTLIGRRAPSTRLGHRARAS